MAKLWPQVRASKSLRWLALNLDPILAAVLAAVFLVLSALDMLEDDALFQATSGVLVVMAFALYRERSSRERAVRRIERVAKGLGSSSAWEVLHGRFEWDIETPDGSTARAVTKKRLRILANQVYSVFEFYSPDGRLGPVSYSGAAPQAPDQALPEMHAELPGPQGRSYRVISLEGIFEHGDLFDLKSTREVADSFTKDREFVRVEVEVPTKIVEIAVVWPAGRPLTELRVERTRAAVETVPVGDLEILAHGRTRYTRSFGDVRVDDEILFVWRW